MSRTGLFAVGLLFMIAGFVLNIIVHGIVWAVSVIVLCTIVFIVGVCIYKRK